MNENIEKEEFLRIDFDTFLEKIGDYGKYQRIRFYFVCVAVVFYLPTAIYHPIFIFSTPEGYRCRSFEESEAKIRFIPANNSKTDEFCTFANVTENFTNQKSCVFGYVYEFYHRQQESLVTEWDLVCENRWIISTTDCKASA